MDDPKKGKSTLLLIGKQMNLVIILLPDVSKRKFFSGEKDHSSEKDKCLPGSHEGTFSSFGDWK